MFNLAFSFTCVDQTNITTSESEFPSRCISSALIFVTLALQYVDIWQQNLNLKTLKILDKDMDSHYSILATFLTKKKDINKIKIDLELVPFTVYDHLSKIAKRHGITTSEMIKK